MKRLFSTLPFLLCSILTTFAEQITVPDITLVQGSATTVEFSLDNEHLNLVAFQMDLTLPEGISIEKNGCRLSSRITDEKQELIIGKLESGGYRIISSSMSLSPFNGTDGTLLTLKLMATGNGVGGQSTISNIRFSTSNSEIVILGDVAFDIRILYKYTLTYIVDGEVYKTEEVVETTPLTPLEEPTKEGYTFSGWSEIPETMPAHDVTVTGTFSINSYKLTYMLDNEVYKEVTYEYGATITPEPTPEGNYASFKWEGLPETMPAKDVVVHAKYTTGINEILMSTGSKRIYSPNGKQLDNMQKGANIIRMKNGTTRKVMKK